MGKGHATKECMPSLDLWNEEHGARGCIGSLNLYYELNKTE